MPIYTRVAGDYKAVFNVWQKIDGSWVQMKTLHIKAANKWKFVYEGIFPFYFNVILSTNQTNYNLRSAALAAGWNPIQPLIASITISSGVVIGSGSSANYAFSTGSSFPEGSSLTITNYGSIIGVGGIGGNGGWIDSAGNLAGSYGPTPGGNGGPALFIGLPTTLFNYGVIAGGGGGGGAGHEYRGQSTINGSFIGHWGGAGGGGQGCSISSPGILPGTPTYEQQYAYSGSISGAGRGSLYGNYGGVSGAGGAGGNGGAFASSGANGARGGAYACTDISPHPPSIGGIGGAAISGQVNLTISAYGTIHGAIL